MLSRSGLQKLSYEWISSIGVEMGGTCSLIHQGPCSIQFFRKLLVVSKLGIKFYLPFHLIPLLLRLRQARGSKHAFNIVLKTLLNYSKSVLFMAILVSVTKFALCVYSSIIPMRMNGWHLLPISITAPLGILLEDSSRRREIANFVLAKAFRSIYVFFNRKGYIRVPYSGIVMHVVLMALCYYFYCQHPSTLKFRGAFQQLWGQA